MAEPQSWDVLTVLSQPAVVAAAVTAAGTYLVATLQKRRESAGRRKRAIVGLHAEILSNMRDLEQTLGQTDFQALGERMRFGARPLHFTYTRNMRFFERNPLEELDLPTSVLHAVVEFYATLESVYSQLDGLRSETFRQISGAGRVLVLQGLGDDTGYALAFGRRAIYLMETELPVEWFHRGGQRLSEGP